MPKPTRHLSVAAAYDAWSAGYDAHDNPMVTAARHILRGAAPAARGQDCLEVGCGTGANLAILREAGARSVAGIDLSPGMLARARARLPGLALHQGSAASAWPIAAAGVDLVLFCLTLEHVAALAPAFREAHRVLRPGGLALVIEIHPELAAAGVAAHFEAADAIVTMPSFPHRLADYRAAAAASGLAVEQLRDWRCADFPAPHPKMAKRDPWAPFALEVRMRKAAPG